MTAAIGPVRSTPAGSGDVPGCGRSQRAVYSERAASAVDKFASTQIRPFVGGRIKLPQVVEIANMVVGIVAVAPEEPEMAAACYRPSSQRPGGFQGC